MSLFLLQATPVPAQTNKVSVGASGLLGTNKIDLSNEQIAGIFGEILNSLPNNMANLLPNSTTKINSSQTNRTLPSQDYFAEIIAKAKELLIEKYSNKENDDEKANKAKLNLGAAPENIKSIAQMQDFLVQAAQLLQPNILQQNTTSQSNYNLDNINLLETNNSIFAQPQPTTSIDNLDNILENEAEELQNIELTRQDITNLLQQITEIFETPQYQTQIASTAFNITAFNLTAFNAQPNPELNFETTPTLEDVSLTDDAASLAKIDISKLSAVQNLPNNQNNFSGNLEGGKTAAIYDVKDFAPSTNAEITPNINFENLTNADLADNAGANLTDINSTDIKSLGANETKDKNIPLIKFEAETSAPNATPFEQISLQIKKLHKAKKGEINLQLNPHELGKVDVSLSSDADNNMVIKIATELFDTYELLKNDKASLEKMLSEIGIKMNDSSLQFSHNGKEGRQQNNFANLDLTGAGLNEVAATDSKIDNDIMQNSIMNLTATIGINIKV
jgi:flagellar hook-length control protein FliK